MDITNTIDINGLMSVLHFEECDINFSSILHAPKLVDTPNEDKFSFSANLYSHGGHYDITRNISELMDFISSECPDFIANLFILPKTYEVKNSDSIDELFYADRTPLNSFNDDGNQNQGVAIAYHMRNGFFGNYYAHSKILLYGDFNNDQLIELEKYDVDAVNTQIDIETIFTKTKPKDVSEERVRLYKEETMSEFKQLVLDRGISEYLRMYSPYITGKLSSIQK